MCGLQINVPTFKSVAFMVLLRPFFSLFESTHCYYIMLQTFFDFQEKQKQMLFIHIHVPYKF